MIPLLVFVFSTTTVDRITATDNTPRHWSDGLSTRIDKATDIAWKVGTSVFFVCGIAYMVRSTAAVFWR